VPEWVSPSTPNPANNRISDWLPLRIVWLALRLTANTFPLILASRLSYYSLQAVFANRSLPRLKFPVEVK
jgi:hypothetical protein